MNKFAKTLLAMTMVVGLGTVAYSRFTSADNQMSLQDAVEAGTAHIRYDKPDMESYSPEVAEFLQKSWDKGQAAVLRDIQTSDNGIINWRQISSGDIDIELRNHMTFKEAMSFNEAYDQRRKALQIGDVYPGALLHPDLNRVIVYWERKDGSVVYFDLRSDNDKEWDVHAGPIELTA